MKKLILLLLICVIAIVGICAFVLDTSNEGTGAGNEGGGIKNAVQSAFSSHPNKDPEKAKAGLERAGYDASLETYTSREDGMVACVDAALVDAETMDDFEWICIYYYKDKASAEAAWPELEQEGADLMEAARELGYGSSVVCKKNGTVVYYGTKNAVDAAK